MVAILIEPAYSNSMWCKTLYSSLTECLRQKRITFCEMYDTLPENVEAVFIIASNYTWIKSTLVQLNRFSIKPILISNQSENITGCNYSCVSSDINGSMKYLLSEIGATGNSNVALYGINTSSLSDVCRVDEIFSLKDDSFDTMQIFVNNGSLANCFEEFYPHRGQFDSVICSNDFAAVSLIKHLQKSSPETLKRISIFSCTETKLSEYYRDMITSINMNFENYGKAAVFIYEKLKAHNYMSNITITVDWNSNSKNKCTKRTAAVKLQEVKSDDNFYNDDEMRDMLTIEHILNISNNSDRLIIKKLIEGITMEQIAQFCFLSENGVKYRIRRILHECDIPGKNELVRLCRSFLTN